MTVLRVSISLTFISLLGVWSTYWQHCCTILVTAAFNWLLLLVKLMIFSLSKSHCLVSKQSWTMASKIRPVEMASAPYTERNTKSANTATLQNNFRNFNSQSWSASQEHREFPSLRWFCLLTPRLYRLVSFHRNSNCSPLPFWWYDPRRLYLIPPWFL